MADRPSFVAIVGAPRCGTTSLARWLSDHPSVHFSAVKEPHFFSLHDLSGLPTAELRDQVQTRYLDRFFAGAQRGDVIAEGSVTYLYVPEQLEPVLRLWPNAKFIVMLRNPMQMLPSLHQRLLFIGDETVQDFGAAWRMSAARAGGQAIPRTCIEPRWLRYDEAAKFGKYLGRLFQAVGRERCHVILFDDLSADPRQAYRDVLEFLALPDDGRIDFKPRRAGNGFRSAWLQRSLKRPPVVTRHLLAGEKHWMRLPGPVPRRGKIQQAILNVRKTLLRWNQAPAPRTPLSLELRFEIGAALRDDNRLLSELLGRDLSHWLEFDHPSVGARVLGDRTVRVSPDSRATAQA